jgi:putative transcriptional regulator
VVFVGPSFDVVAEDSSDPVVTVEFFVPGSVLELAALRNWEHGRREPDAAARSHLAVIERDPERTQEALTEPVL